MITLDDALESISVEYPLCLDVEHNVDDWYGVSTDDGIVAYFGKMEDAFRYRMTLINRLVNP